PMHDAWAERGNALLEHFSQNGVVPGAQGDAQALINGGYTFDFISDRQIAGLKPASKGLDSHGNIYKVVLLPSVRYLPAETFQRLVGLARTGATIAVHGALPEDVSGYGGLDLHRKTLKALAAQLKFASGSEYRVQTATIGKGRFLMSEDLRQLM